MRRRTLLRLLSGLPALAAAGLLPRVGAAADDLVSVTARLLEIPGKFPSDELYDYAYVLKYEVQGGPKDKQILYVAHYKPSQPRAKIKGKMKAHVGGKLRRFHAGDVHQLTLTAGLKTIWPGPLTDEYAAADRKSPRYWCLSVDPA
jgi:hypothetical protein